MNRACSSPSPSPSPSPSHGFKGINRRTLEAVAVAGTGTGTGTGILSSPRSVSPSFATPLAPSKQSTRISPILITPKSSPKDSDDPSKSEPWAGPACFNSPSPSSLPIPKFPPRRKHKSDPSPRTREPYSLRTNYVSVHRVLNLDIDADN